MHPMRVLLARFACGLSCQIGLQLRQQGHYVIAHSDHAEAARLGLCGCDEVMFPCTETHFPYVMGDDVGRVLTERGPFDVVVFDQPDVDEAAGDAGAVGWPRPASLADAPGMPGFRADVRACTRHLLADGGDIWLLRMDDTDADTDCLASGVRPAPRTAHAYADALERIAHDFDASPVAFHIAQFRPLQDELRVITFRHRTRLVMAIRLPHRMHDANDMVRPILDLLVGGACAKQRDLLTGTQGA